MFFNYINYNNVCFLELSNDFAEKCFQNIYNIFFFFEIILMLNQSYKEINSFLHEIQVKLFQLKN